jgi:hypothetical protein
MLYEYLAQLYWKDGISYRVWGNTEQGWGDGRGYGTTRRKLRHQSQGVPALSKSSRNRDAIFQSEPNNIAVVKYFKTLFQNFCTSIKFETFLL